MRARLSIFGLGVFGAASLAVAQAPDLRAVAGRPDVWPREVLTRIAIPAEAKNAPPIPAGTAMKVVGLEGPLINLDYQGGLYVAPIAQTDFLDRATANLASKPAPQPPSSVPSTPLTAPARSQAPPGPRGENALAASLLPSLLVFDPASKVDHLVPAGPEITKRTYLLFQFGGGKRWGKAMEELAPAIRAMRERGGDLETVLVPLQGSTVISAILLYRESRFTGPLVDPRKAEVVTDLWTRFGHAGSFALAIVDPKGNVIVKTVPQDRSVDRFHNVIEALNQVPKAE